MLPTIIYVIFKNLKAATERKKFWAHCSTQYLLTIFKEKFKTDEYSNGQIYFFLILKKKKLSGRIFRTV
jgi:hypothetical protein